MERLFALTLGLNLLTYNIFHSLLSQEFPFLESRWHVLTRSIITFALGAILNGSLNVSPVVQ